MTIIPVQLIALLPLMIIGLMVMIQLLSIVWQRNHCLHVTLSIIGIIAALFSLWFVGQRTPIDIPPLMRVDNYGVLYSGLVLLASLATVSFAYSWIEGYNDNKEEFYLLVLIATLGGVLLANANHLASLFLGIELISLPLFGLIGYPSWQQRGSLEASIKYTILSAVASSFLLFSIALLYAQTGSLSFVSLNKSLIAALPKGRLLLVPLGMMIVAIGFKLSLAPFHLWTPDVYQGAPGPVCIFLTLASKIAIFSVLMRLFLHLSMEESQALHVVLSVISFLSVIFGNLMALDQRNIKRLLGYASISHLGYLMVPLLGLEDGEISIEGVAVYWVGYLFSNLGAFGVVCLISSPYRESDSDDSLSSYRGLFWQQPILALVMTVMMFSLAGIPMTLGFIGKFYLLLVGVQAHLWWLSASVVIGSAIGLYYYLRVTVSLYLIPEHQKAQQKPSPVVLHNWQRSIGGIMVLISALLILSFGIYPQPLINIVQRATPIL